MDAILGLLIAYVVFSVGIEFLTQLPVNKHRIRHHSDPK